MNEVPFASHEVVEWECRTWVADPHTGRWHKARHRFTAVVKERVLQGDACRVCAGFVIDDTNSLQTWFPEIAAELDDDELDPRALPTSRHNAKRREQADGHRYAELPWRCRHGHRWPATIANRVSSGGCPHCSPSGLSKEQIRLTAELAGLLRLVPPDRPDPRLPVGVPDFGSHRIAVPTHLRPAEFRNAKIEVDAIFAFDCHLIGLEYDGAFHHSGQRRDRLAFTRQKDFVLQQLGYLVVHVRLGKVPQLDSPQAIIVALDERASAHGAASAVARALEARLGRAVPRLHQYIRDGRATSADLAEQFITCVWGVKRPRAGTRKPEGTPRKQRQLRATPPTDDSLLTPASLPYRSPDSQGSTLRDYRCRCGTTVIGLVQADVTRGNTRSCGCLARKSKTVRRSSIPRSLAQEARRWAVERGIRVSVNGPVSARLIASYLLAVADAQNIPRDEHGLVAEEWVQEWARREGSRLLARGRLPEQTWYAFATAHGASFTP
ncbi:zinc-ribbon domain-containing protein [Nonomuraea sp. 3-1Str]|uniref:zinc-ribbon domain-containing protein n=1 Tax=Nonomuraea sp. 3-1Str TaxID=2929801 RepID=UPI002860224E|nr:zinc-ribbon domain-containing protein [Nonomuraea sp. 3-1Str]MDR8414628.1 zinc-ribbon domain-containing protein [Nonomuraea sp. 3-1Str]